MRLTPLDPAGCQEPLELEGDNVILGRMARRGLQVDHPTVSREHARIFRTDGDYHVADLNSSNGTFINGAKVSRGQLRPGDVLRLGSVEFRFEDDAAESPLDPPALAPTAPAPPPEEPPLAGEIELEEPAGSSDQTVIVRPRPSARRSAAPPPPSQRPKALGQITLKTAHGPRSGSVLSTDVSQHSFLRQLALIVLALAIAAGLFILVMRLTERVVPEGGLPQAEEVDGGE